MSLKIQNIQTDRIYDVQDDVKFHYRVLEPIVQKRLLFANMKNGKIDQDRMFEMSYEFMELMLTNWIGIVDDENEKPIKFKKELERPIPLEIANDFVVAVLIPSFQNLITSANKITPKKQSTEEN